MPRIHSNQFKVKQIQKRKLSKRQQGDISGNKPCQRGKYFPEIRFVFLGNKSANFVSSISRTKSMEFTTDFCQSRLVLNKARKSSKQYMERNHFLSLNSFDFFM